MVTSDYLRRNGSERRQRRRKEDAQEHDVHVNCNSLFIHRDVVVVHKIRTIMVIALYVSM